MNEKALQRIFGEVLRELRKERKLSQEKLGELTNLHDRYISLLERGLRQPTLSTIFKLANALGISLLDLLKPVVERFKN